MSQIDTLKKDSSISVAIITHDFSGFSGSQVVALEIANYHASCGHKVIIRAERHSELLMPYLHENCSIAKERIDISDYDIVWSMHGHFCLNTKDLNRLKEWKGKFISIHLSGSTPAETYHHYFSARFSNARVFNCEQAMDLLEHGQSVVGKSYNMKNAAPGRFHNFAPSNAVKLQKLLVVSNHLPQEVEDALKILTEQNIDVKHIGAAGSYKLLQPQDILDADAVLTIGKTVQYALCGTRPVYCYDHFGGPGWINDDNFPIAENRNFSGRCSPLKKTPNQIVNELILGFEETKKFVEKNWSTFSTSYNLEGFLDHVLSEVDGNLFDSDECLNLIDLMRGSMIHVNWIWGNVFSKAELIERDSQIASLNQAVVERDGQINALFNTNSWRITQSLRFVAHQIKRVLYIARLLVPAIEQGGGIKNTLRKAIKIYEKEGFQGIKRGFRLVANSQIASDIKNIDPIYQKLVSYPAEKLLVPRVLIIAEMNISQCKKYRVQQKQEMFRLLDVDCTVLSWCDTQICLDALQTHSLVIFYRVPAFPGLLSIINEAKRLRLPTLWEVDDFIFDREVLAKSRTLAALDKNTFAELLEGADLYRKAMLMCDKGIASTSSLADLMDLAGLCEVYVVENALDRQTLEVAEQISREHAILQDDIVRIVYGSGTNTHNIDFHEAAPAIIRILDMFPNVHFRIIGILDLPETFSRYQSQIERLPFCTFEEYLVNLAECDISIAPLENYIFNDSKSNIKFLEASIVKVPSVCSPRAAFSQVIIHGKNGFLCETDDEWEAALKLLVTDAAKRVEVSEAAYSSVIHRYSPESVAQQQIMPLLERHKRSSDTLRVLSVNCYYHPRSFGGATIVAEQLNKHVNAQEGFEIHVFTTLSSSVATPYTIKRYEDSGINIYGVGLPDYLDEKTQFENPEIIEAFARVLAVVQPDIVHFHSIQGIGVSVVDLCAQKDIKYVITLHDAWWLCGRQFMINKQGKYCEQNKIDLKVCATCIKNDSLNIYRSERLGAALHNASILLAPSRFFADFYIANGFSNVTVNKNGIVKPNVSRRLRRKGDLRFGYVGGNTEIKGIHLVKKVFSDLADFSVKLVLVDNTLNVGYASYHQQDLVGIPNVEIVPAYNQSTIDNFFASIDVLLFPTQWKESFGLTVREALVRNVWVITTDAGGVPEDIRHGKNGFIIPFDDRGQALKQAVLETIEYFKHYAVGDEICFKPDNITFFEDQAAELAHILKNVVSSNYG